MEALMGRRLASVPLAVGKMKCKTGRAMEKHKCIKGKWRRTVLEYGKMMRGTRNPAFFRWGIAVVSRIFGCAR